MKKVISIILIVVSLAMFALSIFSDNAEMWNIQPSLIATISSILLAIQQFAEKLKMFTETEVIDAIDFKANNNMSAKHTSDAKTLFNQWKSKRAA